MPGSVSITVGFWRSVAYFVVALVFTWFLLLSLTALAQKLSKDEGQADGFLLLAAPSFMKLGGLLPLFMYAGYVAEGLRQLTGIGIT